MTLQRFSVKGQVIAADDPGLQAVLAELHGSPERPRCLCVPGGVEMYVARHATYLVKRMPGSGGRHHPGCDAFEPDSCQSGLGELLGGAVQESEHGAEVRLKFALTMGAGRNNAPGRGEPGPDVKLDKQRMSMKAVIHYLFDKAGFNRWHPAMAGKRSQFVLHKFLSEAAARVTTRGVNLGDRLLVPEAFREDRQSEIAARHLARLAALYGAPGVARPMSLVLAEFKSCEPCQGGFRLLLRHLPDVPLLVDPAAWRRIHKRYEALFAAREARAADARVRPRVVLCALVYARQERVFQVDTACCMLTSANWIPVDAVHELDLVDALTAQRRSFFKPLSYDARPASQFANALLLDTGAVPTALHMLSPFMDARERSAKESLLEAEPAAWVWNTEQSMPDLPPPARGQLALVQ